MKRIKLLWTFVFWLFVNTTAISAIINHDISTASLTIPGTSTDDYVITGSTTTNYVDVGTGYQGTITLKNCTIELMNVSHSCIKIHGQNNQSNLFPLTNVKIVLDGNNRLFHQGNGGYPAGWAALQVDQGAQINIGAINPHNNTSGTLDAIIGTQNGGAAIGALCNNAANEARGIYTGCPGTTATAGGNIIISSGTITVQGGHGAGIGGGYMTYYDGMIVIYGGIVDSRAGRHAAGIGSGCPTGTGVATCFTPNSAIIVLPPAEITAFGVGGVYGNIDANLGLAGANNIVYIGDPEKPLVTVRTVDFEPNADIYVDLSMNPSIASVISTVIPSNEFDINKVKFGKTNSAGLYFFNGILNDNTTFFTDASSSQPATLGRPYLPEMVILPSGGTVILKLLDTDLSLLPSPSIPLIEGFSTLEAFTNAYRVRLIYNDNNNMTDVVFDLANGAATYFASMRFFTTNGTEITAPNSLTKGDTLDIVIPIKDMSRASSYSDVLRLSGKILGAPTGYIRQVVSQVVIKSLSETVCGSFFFKNKYQEQTGVYVDTLQSTLGLDSIVMLNLIVHPIFNDTIYTQICDNDSILFGGKYYFTQNIYTDSLKTVLGCDSLSTLNLIVNPTFNDTIYEVICDNDSILFGGKYYFTQGIYTDSLKTISNCDSLSTLNLIVNPTFNDTIYTQICDNDSILFGGKYYFTQGIYTDSLKTISNCDSLSTLNLIVNPTFNDTVYTQICDSDSILFGGKYYFNQGIYTDSLKTISNCDSLSTLNLIVNPTFNDTIYTQICDNDSILFGGKYYFTQNIYTDSLKTVLGCDSLSTLNLIVNPVYRDTINATICLRERYNQYNFDTIPKMAGFISYSQNLKTIKNCDSIVTLNLTINPSYYDTINATICLDEDYIDSEFNIIPTISGFFTYTHSYKTSKNCDSIITLNLTVNPIYDFYITDTIYEDEFYVIGNDKYNTSGLHIAQLQTHAGCDSIINLTLHIINYPPEITAFSPFNYDGINDYFMAGFKIQVFNRHGTLIYETKTKEQQISGWNGKNTTGKDVEPGLYFYILYNSTNKPRTKSSVEVLK